MSPLTDCAFSIFFLIKWEEISQLTSGRKPSASIMEAVKLMEAVEERNLGRIKGLLKRRKFDMSAEEMDELLLQLPETSLSDVEEFLSPRALLCIAAKKGEFAKVNWSLELRASSFASAAFAAAQHGHKFLAEKLFERSCKTDDKLWDSEAVLPLLYDAFHASPQDLSSNVGSIAMLKGYSASQRQVPLAFMHFAAKINNGYTLCQLLDTWGTGNVDSVYLGDRTNTTLLHRASYHGHVEVVELLLEKGARMDKVDHTGHTPLHIATIQGHLLVVKVLLANDPCKKLVNHQDHEGMTPLHLAACGGYVAVMRELLKAGAKPEITAKKEGMSSKFYSLFLGKLLESSRAGIKNQSQNEYLRLNPITSMFWNPGGFTTLHFAVVYGGPKVTRELLENESVDCKMVGTKDTQGLTAYDWAKAKDLDESAILFHGLGEAICHECSFSKDNAKGFCGGPEAAAYDWAKAQSSKDLTLVFCDMVEAISPNSSFKTDKAKALMRECNKLEKEKMEVEWAERLGWALRNGQWEVAQMLAEKASRESMTISSNAWEHFKWACEVDGAVQEDWKSDKRKCLKPHELIWNRKVEEVMLILFKSNASTDKSKGSTEESEESIDKVVLQDCLIWSMKKYMVDLAIEVAGKKDCDLMEVAHGCCGGDIPLEFAASWPKESQGSSGRLQNPRAVLRPVLQAMEQRKDVRNRIYEDRQLYVDFLNAVLVASVLIAGLAFSSLLQPPKSVESLPGSRDESLAKLFGWSNHISFYFALVSTFSGICGAIPSPAGELAYSKKRMQRSGFFATIFITGAVICHSFAFTAAALDLLKIHSKLRHQVKIFSIITGCASSAVLLWLLSRLLHVYDPIHKISHWGARYHLIILTLFLIEKYLAHLHKRIMPPRYQQRVCEALINCAYMVCKGDTSLLCEKKHITHELTVLRSS